MGHNMQDVPQLMGQCMMDVPQLIVEWMMDVPQLMCQCMQDVPQLMGQCMQDVPQLMGQCTMNFLQLMGQCMMDVPQPIGQWMMDVPQLMGQCMQDVHQLMGKCMQDVPQLMGKCMIPKLDYCNFIFYGSPMYMLERLQKVQNPAARHVFQCREQNHISPLLMSLHWLPINARIEYKFSVICQSFFLGLFSTQLVWSTLNLHTQNKFTLFLWQYNSMYP